jgi:hypothetical protein
MNSSPSRRRVDPAFRAHGSLDFVDPLPAWAYFSLEFVVRVVAIVLEPEVIVR